MSDERKGDWIQTYSGRKFWPLDPRPEDVDIRDIAHALSNICRFTGHTKMFYSVAQHCVIASQIVPPEAAMLALLHDAAEAYMGDIARPWKRFLRVSLPGTSEATATLKFIESTLLNVILASLNVQQDDAMWEQVKSADELLLVTEARDFMSPLVDGWRHVPANGFAILPERINPWNPGRACYEFMSRFETLKRKVLVRKTQEEV